MLIAVSILVDDPEQDATAEPKRPPAVSLEIESMPAVVTRARVGRTRAAAARAVVEQRLSTAEVAAKRERLRKRRVAAARERERREVARAEREAAKRAAAEERAAQEAAEAEPEPASDYVILRMFVRVRVSPYRRSVRSQGTNRGETWM